MMISASKKKGPFRFGPLDSPGCVPLFRLRVFTGLTEFYVEKTNAKRGAADQQYEKNELQHDKTADASRFDKREQISVDRIRVGGWHAVGEALVGL
jgi:hypothetical protein